MKKISILGCGWLGLPLGKAFADRQYLVKGSTTTEAKLPKLEANGIQPFLIAVSEDDVDGDLAALLEGSEILIIDIPPKSKDADFTKKMETLLPHLEKSGIGKVIFISSISVYSDDNNLVTEATPANPTTENGKQLVISEQLLKASQSFDTTIIRFGGLIGEDRHPVKFLSVKPNNENPDSPINLIHLEDCIGIIMKIIDRGIYGEVFNAVTPFHPTRKNYYTQKAFEKNLDLPGFLLQQSPPGKIISADKIENVLGYRFIVPNL